MADRKIGARVDLTAMGRSVFVYGTLCHLPLLEIVLGREATVVPATLPGWTVTWAKDNAFPLIEMKSEAVATGLLLRNLEPEDVARLDFYEAGFGYDLKQVTVGVNQTKVAAEVYIPHAGRWLAGPPWSLDDWAAEFGKITELAAVEFMALWPDATPQKAARVYPRIRDRAAANLRAVQDASPRIVRKGGADRNVRVASRRTPYTEFFSLVEWDLTFPMFDGGQSKLVSRSAFVGGDAVTVLPYDPRRDRVMVIEQFRFAPLVRGDPCPWSLEPIAGRIDAGETPEDTARREAMEETGLTLGRLVPIGRYYPSPGAVTEYIYSYIAIADLPDDAAGLGGAPEEAEDIRAILMSFDEFMTFLDSGEAENGPLILTALSLARMRDALRTGK